MKVGIVGCGAIGSFLAREIQRTLQGRMHLAGVCDVDPCRTAALKKSLRAPVKNFSLAELAKRVDLLIEAAGMAAVPPVFAQALRQRADVMVMSSGGLLKQPGLLARAKKRGVRVYVPSGALAGLDAVKAARQGKIRCVTLTTTKPLDSLRDAPYVKERGIDLDRPGEEIVVFEGTALQAVAGFPQNINVAAALSLAGVGGRRTRVRIVASRTTQRNTHSIEITGDFGTIRCCTENVPSARNPKTSRLAMYAALAMLEDLAAGVRIGT